MEVDLECYRLDLPPSVHGIRGIHYARVHEEKIRGETHPDISGYNLHVWVRVYQDIRQSGRGSHVRATGVWMEHIPVHIPSAGHHGSLHHSRYEIWVPWDMI